MAEMSLDTATTPTPNTQAPPFVWVHLEDAKGLVVESNLDPTKKLALLKAAETLVIQQVLVQLMPKKPAVITPNGLARRIFGR